MNEELLGDGGGVRVAAIGPMVDLHAADPFGLRGDLAQEYHVEDPVGQGAPRGLLKDELCDSVAYLILADFQA